MKKTTTLPILALLFAGLILSPGCKKKSDSNNSSSNTVTDIDGNVYHSVTIGTQVWMAENLKVTHYRNGIPIAHVTDNATWDNLTSGAYCNFENNEGNGTVYGRLYNWYASVDGLFITPAGWHIPSDAEWTTLVTYLGGETIAGGKLKETGTAHWETPNTGATNETGFSALPGGLRIAGVFDNLTEFGYWWSSSEISASDALFRDIDYAATDIFRASNNKSIGMSVRCIKD
jgi:uncharacterized protein (TIGR02145 family)